MADLSITKKHARRSTRANLNDLQRFEVMLLRKKRSAAVRKLAKKFVKEGGAAKKGAAAPKGKKK